VDPERWATRELEILMEALQGILMTFDRDMGAFEYALGDITIYREEKNFWSPGTRGMVPTYPIFGDTGNIYIYDDAFDDSDEFARAVMIHEIGHAFDYGKTYRGGGHWFTPNRSFTFFNGTIWPKSCNFNIGGQCFSGVMGTAASGHAETKSSEDFAETFVVSVHDANAWALPADLGHYRRPDQQRLDAMRNIINLTVEMAPQGE
jgi:hypothetical protein